MRGRLPALLLAVCACHQPHPASGPSPAPPPASSPSAAISYREIRENGDERTIASTNGSIRGVDINSSIRIEVDESRLTSLLAGPSTPSPDVAELQQRMDALRRAAEVIPAFDSHLAEAERAWHVADSTRNFAGVRDMIRATARLDSSIMAPLTTAIQSRLLATNVPVSVAESQAVAAVSGIRVYGTGGYDWNRFTAVLAGELAYLRSQMDSRAVRPGLSIEIRAHRIGRNGPVAVALPGYNSVIEGAEERYEKLPLAPDSSELALYQRYDSTLRTVSSVRNAGDVLRTQLEVELGGSIGDLDSAFAAARGFLDQAQTDLRALRAYAASDLQPWLAQFRTTLDASAQGAAARAALEQLDASFTGADLDQELHFLSVLADLRGTLSGMTPPQALQRLLGVTQMLSSQNALRALDMEAWSARADLAAAASSTLAALANDPQVRAALSAPTSPVTVLRGSADSMRNAVTRLSQHSAAGIALLTQVIRGTPQVASADLPVPTGQQRVELGGGSADAMFSLRTIREGRLPDDRVLVTMRFFRGDQPLPVAVRDEFRVMSYGWNASFEASLTWVLRQHSSVWTPTAALSWMARMRRWPAGGDLGLKGDWPVSVGLTTMSLDFDNGQAVEVGLAPTVGVFNNRLLVGAGGDLQAATNRWFAFLAVRLFGNGGGLGGQ